jgi:aryl-phospho-beta-D-glucosidase BglC (GH1 family)
MAPPFFSKNTLAHLLIGVAALTSTVSASPVSTPVAQISTRFPYGSTKVRGVNLGGWLVLEPWITPSIFDNTGDSRIVDEYTYGQYVSKSTAQSVLQNHWNTFITEADFAAIAAAGLNHVRLPIGYWAFDVSGGEPFVQGQLPYLYKAVTWAQNHGIKVWIDLHGVPGSQNGFDNSGQKMDSPKWHTSPTNIARASAIIKTLAAEFSKDQYASVVTAIAPLNEPAGYRSSDLLAATRQYWYDSYGNIRYPFGTSQQGNLVEVIHDAFQPLSYWNQFAPWPSYDGVLIDTHHYQVFSVPELQRTWDQHIQAACSRGNEIQSYSSVSGNLWTIVGEWTTTPYDCAKYLNGRGVGARYDGTIGGGPVLGNCSPFTGSSSKFSSDYKNFMRKFWEAQVVAFEKSQGWIYWTWKTESTDEWSYQKGLAGGWIPKDPSQRLYPGICG